MFINKTKKSIAILLALLTFLSVFSLLAMAEETNPEKSKYYGTVRSGISITSSGLLTATNYYDITGSGFTSAKIETYVEKKILGLFWVKVDNGQPNKTWVDTSTSTMYAGGYNLQLSSTGTYRMTADYTFYGTNGTETARRQATTTY